MSNFRFKFLNNIDLSGLIALHNEVAKIGGKLDKLSLEELKTKIQTEGIELGLSIGGYSGLICASDFGVLVPVISVKLCHSFHFD